MSLISCYMKTDFRVKCSGLQLNARKHSCERISLLCLQKYFSCFSRNACSL